MLHWLAGMAPAGTCLDSTIPAGVATARRGRASNKAVAERTRANIFKRLKSKEGLEVERLSMDSLRGVML